MGHGPVSRRWKAFTYAILIVYTVFCIAPLLWVFSTSLKSKEESNRFPPTLIPHSLHFENYLVPFQSRFFGTYPFVNSLTYALGTVVLTLTITTLSGFAFSRFRFKGRQLWFLLILFLDMMPGVAKLVPLYLLYVRYGLYDSRIGLILVYSVMLVPLGTWIMKGYFDRIPRELEECALIDGTTRLGSLWRITLPLAAPGLGALAVIAFMDAWNHFTYPLILLSSQELLPYTVAIYTFVGDYGRIEWPVISAVSVISVLPLAALFVVFQRTLVRGLTGGAMKG
jgi:multiple sugar transport system permease protein